MPMLPKTLEAGSERGVGLRVLLSRRGRQEAMLTIRRMAGVSIDASAFVARVSGSRPGCR